MTNFQTGLDIPEQRHAVLSVAVVFLIPLLNNTLPFLKNSKNLKLNFLTPVYKTKDYEKVTKETYHVGSPTGSEVSPTVKSGLNFSLALIFSQNNPATFTLTFVNDPSLSLANSVAYPCVMSGTLQNYPSKLKLNLQKAY